MRIKYNNLKLGSQKGRYFTGRWVNNSVAFTLLELLVVIVIIATLAALMFPALNGIVNSARATGATNGLRDMVNATINWSVDHSNKIPSPLYTDVEPEDEEEYKPTGTGLWCDGVIFKNLYPDTDPASPGPSRAEAGGHLIGTVFESIASVNAHPDELDWYRHSYGMNKDIVPDELSKTADDPQLTEKSIANIEFLSSAMIYMDSVDANIIDAATMSEGAIKKAAERYRDKFVLVVFMDGHVLRMNPAEIPLDKTSQEGSRFWRGVDPK